MATTRAEISDERGTVCATCGHETFTAPGSNF
jgi:hypothetical protein